MTGSSLSAQAIEQQQALYGVSLGDAVRSIAETLKLSQAGVARVLGLSAPMLSQLVNGQRLKIGNPIAVQRLHALLGLVEEVHQGLPFEKVAPETRRDLDRLDGHADPATGPRHGGRRTRVVRCSSARGRERPRAQRGRGPPGGAAPRPRRGDPGLRHGSPRRCRRALRVVGPPALVPDPAVDLPVADLDPGPAVVAWAPRPRAPAPCCARGSSRRDRSSAGRDAAAAAPPPTPASRSGPRPERPAEAARGARAASPARTSARRRRPAHASPHRSAGRGARTPTGSAGRSPAA